MPSVELGHVVHNLERFSLPIGEDKVWSPITRPMKTMPRGDEFAHGEDIGRVFQDNRFGRVTQLVYLDIGPFAGIHITVSSLQCELGPMRDGVHLSDRKITTADNIEGGPTVDDPRTHRRVRAGPPGAAVPPPRGSGDTLKKDVGV